MSVAYEFSVGDRVNVGYGFNPGVVESTAPGNGSVPWYYVRLERDGSVDRYTADSLEAL